MRSVRFQHRFSRSSSSSESMAASSSPPTTTTKATTPVSSTTNKDEDSLGTQVQAMLISERSEDVLSHTNGPSVSSIFGDASEERLFKPVEKENTLESEVNSEWESTVRTCAQAVVSIRVNLVRAFDTERANSSQATGFIVDIEQGIIVTNRHVITPGPITAEAVFNNHEEVSIWPIYRDPVHDFGFFKFDVNKVRYTKLREIPLAPHRARVGMDIRVMGNDSAEKLSILTGTLARLDRAAPFYGVGNFNDFNTFYFQAASGTSGGSSGSPVLDVQGHAIAMNAGGKKKAASSFYLPLDRVQRALRLIQQGQQVTRGTLQCVFKYEPYDEVRRLGLRTETEQTLRNQYPNNTGMLVVEHVTPCGPASGHLESGDVLIAINDVVVTQFVEMEAIIDDAVHQTITLHVQRGGKSVFVSIVVGDLHAITPDAYVTISGAILHELSYQMAYTYAVAVSGVFVACAGYMLGMAGIQRGCVISMVNNIPTPTLNDFVNVMLTLQDNIRIPMKFYSLNDLHRDRVCIVQIDRHWHTFARAQRDDVSGIWKSKPYPPPTSFFIPPPLSVSLQSSDNLSQSAACLLPSLVTVETHLPFIIDGVHGSNFIGSGLIVDTQRGLVIVDGNTVPIAIADINIIFASSLTVPGRIVFQHPCHNFVVICYDPNLIGTTPVRAATLATRRLQQGDSVCMVGMTKSQQIVSRPTAVTSVHEMTLRECNPPRFRATNIDAIEVDHPITCQGGVLTNDDGMVRAIWACYSYQEQEGEDLQIWAGLDVCAMWPVLNPLFKGNQPSLRSLEIECWPCPIVTARSMGLNSSWVERFEAGSATKRTVLTVRRLIAGTEASNLLKEGDILLTANDRLIMSFSDLDFQLYADSVVLRLVRDGSEIVVDVPTMPLEGHRTERIIGWSGVILQKPHRAVAQQRRALPGGVYSSYWTNGSPAQMYNLRATMWITEVNGVAVPDLDSFLEVIKRCHDDNSYIRIKTVDFTSRVKVLTLKPDSKYWPLWELRRDPTHPATWALIQHH